MLADLVELYVRQAVNRCASVAKAEDSGTVIGEHIEQILPQLMLDFF